MCFHGKFQAPKGCVSEFQSLGNAPLFVCDLKSEWVNKGNPKTPGVTGDMYAYMVTKYAVPAVNKVYGQRAVWQDDPATIHRTPAALEASDAFTSRIPTRNKPLRWPIVGPSRIFGPL